MRNEWNKCNFCKWQSDWGCENICVDHDQYKPYENKLIEKAKEKGVSVADVLVLIELGER